MIKLSYAALYPDPAALIPRLKNLYQLAGLKSEAKYMTGAKSVLVLDGGTGELRFIPTKNEGRRGFSHLVDQKFSLPLHEIDNAGIGQCVRAALERSS